VAHGLAGQNTQVNRGTVSTRERNEGHALSRKLRNVSRVHLSCLDARLQLVDEAERVCGRRIETCVLQVDVLRVGPERHGKRLG